jgi:hypothetical protein
MEDEEPVKETPSLEEVSVMTPEEIRIHLLSAVEDIVPVKETPSLDKVSITTPRSTPNPFEVLPDENVHNILIYLRSTDLAALRETCKAFNEARVSRVIHSMLKSVYCIDMTGLPNPEVVMFRPDYLYVHEMRLLVAALSPATHFGAGYWVSTTWLSNAKKYYEALPLPDAQLMGGIGIGGTPKKTKVKSSSKLVRIRQRRSSSALPPWPDMNTDIKCEHNGLAMAKEHTSKRRMVTKKTWQTLCMFYPDSTKFKSNKCSECASCIKVDEEAKQLELFRREEVLSARQTKMTDLLWTVAGRAKNGVPSCALTRGMLDDETALALATAISVAEGEGLGASDIDIQDPQPLQPGLYHLVPRNWLKCWRLYLKDPEQKSLPQLDSTGLLCHAHSMLMVPTHVDDFLTGRKRNLLGGLGGGGGGDRGEQYEIVMSDEWDELATVTHDGRAAREADFTVRFSCDGECIHWSLDVCQECYPWEPPASPVRSSSGSSGKHRRNSFKSEK